MIYMMYYVTHGLTIPLFVASSSPSSPFKKKTATGSTSPTKISALDNMRRVDVKKTIPITNSVALPIGSQSQS